MKEEGGFEAKIFIFASNQENENGENHLRIENPVQQIHKYKEEIYELYCPRLAQNLGYAVITAGIIFPFSEEEPRDGTPVREDCQRKM